MQKNVKNSRTAIERFLNRLGLGLRGQLIAILLVEKILPMVVLIVIALEQVSTLGTLLQAIAVEDSSKALNDSATVNIERMTTDTARRVAEFLYERDTDILYLADMEKTEERFSVFLDSHKKRVMEVGLWDLAEDGSHWVRQDAQPVTDLGGTSSNPENNDMDGFHYRSPENDTYINVPLYDEITFVGLDGQELIKVVAKDSPKTFYPMSTLKRDVSKKENTYVKAENYFEELQKMKPGEIYVSDVTGAYVGSNYIGMYTPEQVQNAAEQRGYDIPYLPREQAYAGQENPNGQRFEGIVRFATPVADASGQVIGYVTMALNHDHIMEFVDHITPMNERYTTMPSAYEGNYAFIWDYKCRSICHPRHHSIVGFDPETGKPQVPWLESSIYKAWQMSMIPDWEVFTKNWPTFNGQSRSKKPAPELTRAGLVGLDGRYLNNAPQCIGWMDLTREGGSGSFYILWSGLYKLTTAAAIPYYTGHYAPSEENGYSKRGFGFVAIGAGLDDFTRPATETGENIEGAIDESLGKTYTSVFITIAIIVLVMVLFAVLISSTITGNITRLIKGVSRFRKGERHFRFKDTLKDEFGTLADSFDEMAESIVQSVKNPLCIADMKHGVIYMNEYALGLCNKSLDEVIGTYYGDTSVYPAKTRHDPILAFEEGREADIYCVQKGKHYIRGIANYFIDKDGEKLGYIIETIDVTEMVLEQIKIEEQRALLEKIFETSPDLIWYVDAVGEYMAVNPRFAEIAGKPVEAFKGKKASDMMDSETALRFVKSDDETLETKQPVLTSELIEFADGHIEMLDSVRMPLFDQASNVIGMLGFARNVNARVQIENELRTTQLHLEKVVKDANLANAHKGDFLARMSHEIRTPMNAVIGLATIVQKKLQEMMEPGNGIEQISDYVRQIEGSSQHLLGLLNDILDISKIEAGKIELVSEPMRLDELISTVSVVIKPRCDEKDVLFETCIDLGSQSPLMGDALRLRQVLINLLGNAVKFTPPGGVVTFRVRELKREDGRVLLNFCAQDTGIGISEEALEGVFLPFEQADKKTATQYGGTGLGLPIARNIVQLFGGDITVSSKVGEGSEFAFSIWLMEAKTQIAREEPTVDASIFAGKRILLVDDVAINRMIVMAMLEETGMVIDEAVDGTDALKRFEDADENTYDAILMDVLMPNMNGYEATRAIRETNRADSKTVPIIAITANAFQEDKDRVREAGMNDHIAKPVDMHKLFHVLSIYLAKH